jgi:predicted transcriptional regulator
MDTLIILIKNGRPMTLEEIGKEANREKVSIFRSTQKLVRLGICSKETRTSKGGGQFHIYSAIPVETFKKETERRVRELETSIRRILRGFEKDMEDMISSFYKSSSFTVPSREKKPL